MHMENAHSWPQETILSDKWVTCLSEMGIQFLPWSTHSFDALPHIYLCLLPEKHIIRGQVVGGATRPILKTHCKVGNVALESAIGTMMLCQLLPVLSHLFTTRLWYPGMPRVSCYKHLQFPIWWLVFACVKWHNVKACSLIILQRFSHLPWYLTQKYLPVVIYPLTVYPLTMLPGFCNPPINYLLYLHILDLK